MASTTSPDAMESKFFKYSLITLALLVPGPLLVLVAALSGANIFDGFMGVYSNTPTQAALINYGWNLSIGGGLVGLVFSIVNIVRFSKYDKKYLFLPFVCLILPLVLLVGVSVLGSGIRYCIEFPSACIGF